MGVSCLMNLIATIFCTAVFLLVAPLMVSGELCSCIAYEENFEIGCYQVNFIESLEFLEDNCASSCTQDCQEHYYIVQAHHDYCNSFEISKDVQKRFHVFLGLCEACEISKKWNERYPACPDVDCGDTQSAVSALNYIQNLCQEECESEGCAEAFQTARAFHDWCTLPDDLGEQFHSYEYTCEAVDCNSGEELPKNAKLDTNIECPFVSSNSPQLIISYLLFITILLVV